MMNLKEKIEDLNIGSNYFDREGNQIDYYKWADYFSDKNYQIIKQDEIMNLLISTVWLGINHSMDKKNPVIFETMVFKGEGNGKEIFTKRYTNLEHAKLSHDCIVELLESLAELNS